MDTALLMQWTFAPALATALLHSLWQVTLLALGAALALAALSRGSAALRHTVAMGFLLAMVLVPASTFVRVAQQPATRLHDGWLPAITAPQLDAVSGTFVQQSSSTAVLLALAWLCGVGVMLLRRFGGWRWLATLDRHPFQSLPVEWQQRVDALRGALGITRAVAVKLSGDVVGPFTARLLRPVIWLPLSLLTQLPREQVEALLAHELAHIARMDWLWNGVQCVVESLLFFHPAAWWLGRRIRQEREHACDDLAVVACGDAIALAEALAQLEHQRHSAPRLVLAAHGGSLMQRITRLLSTPPTRGRWGARAGLVVLVASGALLASQVGITGHGQPGVRIQSSTDGVLRPGDVREITATGSGTQRYYRGSVDADGRLVEVYKQDGQVRPLDADARRWVAGVVRLSVPPAPPLPPLPPAPPSIADLPVPPPPPAPPEVAETAVFQSLLRVVAADPAVIARLGSPVVMASNDVGGSIDIGPRDADVDVTFALRGPKGRADVHVDAQLDDGAWSMDAVDFESAVR